MFLLVNHSKTFSLALFSSSEIYKFLKVRNKLSLATIFTAANKQEDENSLDSQQVALPSSQNLSKSKIQSVSGQVDPPSKRVIKQNP